MATGLQRVMAADLDESGSIEIIAVSHRSLSIVSTRLVASSLDGDRDGIPDECAGRAFRRADANANGRLDLSDGIAILNHLFRAGAPLTCREAADANDDGALGLTDAIYALNFLFLNGRAIPRPYPGCGRDTTPDSLGCEAFASCQ